VSSAVLGKCVTLGGNIPRLLNSKTIKAGTPSGKTLYKEYEIYMSIRWL
jgi:hypothetical protein